MPWCEECARYFAPSAMRADGACPACGRSIEAQSPGAAGQRTTPRNLDLRRLAAGVDGNPDDEKAPWHFKLLVVLLALYLGWRVIDLFLG